MDKPDRRRTSVIARPLIRGLLALVLSLAIAPPVRASISYSPPFPEGTIGVSRPLIGIRVTTNGESILSARITVDGNTMSARREGSLLIVEPAIPLAPGRHSARVEIVLDGGRWRPIDRSWEFTVAPGALAELPPPRPEQQTVLAEVNRLRADADLPPLRFHPALNAATQAHADYYLQTPVQGLGAHSEDPNRPGFTGRQPWERGQYFGYPYKKYYEDLHFIADHPRAVRDWMDSVYHRFPLTDPNVTDLGYGYNARNSTMVNVLNTAASGSAPSPDSAFTDPEITVYPIPGQRDVPLRWDGNEEPDPYRFFPGARAAGYPVTIQFNSPLVNSSRLDYAVMSGENGEWVPLWLLTGDLDDAITPHIALLPARDLAPGKRYQVQIRGNLRLQDGTTQPFARTWWFTTTGLQEPPQNQPDIRIFLNEAPFLTDTSPAVKNGRVLLPLRSILEALGATVTWDGERRTVEATGKDRMIVLKINNDRALVNDEEQRLDAAPSIANGRTLVPVRFIATALGLQVRWDPATRAVYIITRPGTN